MYGTTKMVSHMTRVVDASQGFVLVLLAICWGLWFILPFTLFMPKLTVALAAATALGLFLIGKFATRPFWKN